MHTEEQLAAARMAQVFGSELLRIQKTSRTDSGAEPHVVSLNPQNFLNSGPQANKQTRQQQKNIMEHLQREAELAHPLSEVPFSASLPEPSFQPAQQTIKTSEPIIPYLERIASSLEKICVALEEGNATIKSKPKSK